MRVEVAHLLKMGRWQNFDNAMIIKAIIEIK